jgi:cytochrome c553
MQKFIVHGMSMRALFTRTALAATIGLLCACKPPPVPEGALPPSQSEGNVRPTAQVSVPPSPQIAVAPVAAPVGTPAVAPAIATLVNTASSETNAKLYTVVDGTKVDASTMEGFRTWRAAACDRCHGANQEGMVGPSLLASLKVLSKDEFVKTLKEGRLEKGMPSWSTNTQVMGNMDKLYAYLKGRSDGAITQARVSQIP